jgi:hypothetical protein
MMVLREVDGEEQPGMSSQTADRRWIPAVAMAFAAAGLVVVPDCVMAAGDEAAMAREMTLAGRPLRGIKAAVYQQFSDIGPGTDTPLPPE